MDSFFSEKYIAFLYLQYQKHFMANIKKERLIKNTTWHFWNNIIK